MKLKLDVKDKRVLSALDINSRQSNQLVANSARISKQVAGFRIKRFIENGLITSFYTIIDISKLSRTAHKNFVRLQNITPEKEKEFINYFMKHPKIVWCASSDGRFDFIFSVWASNLAELDQTLKEVNNKYGQFIAERQISTIIRGEYFPRSYLLESKNRNQTKIPFFEGVPKEERIDSINVGILRLIATNSRLSAVTIGQKIGLSADAVASRIKKLENSGIIRGYTIIPDENKYPFIHYKLLISFRSASGTAEDSLQEYCKTTPNIVYFVKALGQWDYEIDLEVETQEEFRSILMDLKTKFKESIKDYSALTIYKVHNYNFCPSNPYEL